jgi:hypothetical protein
MLSCCTWFAVSWLIGCVLADELVISQSAWTSLTLVWSLRSRAVQELLKQTGACSIVCLWVHMQLLLLLLLQASSLVRSASSSSTAACRDL